MPELNLNNIHPSWQPLIKEALAQVNPEYLCELTAHTDWLPGNHMIFNAFSLPLSETNYILFGESPYPRAQSANGYAFWDNAVTDLWSPQGLSKTVNRATSLRNFIKMLLLTHGRLTIDDLSQPAISALPKTDLVCTAADLFGNMQKKGILLLNASLVLSNNPVKYDAKAWQPFMRTLLTKIHHEKPNIKLILLGKIAEIIPALYPPLSDNSFIAEHPYNLSFITNPDVQIFFQPFNLIFKNA
jgi:uracil-DNA glycosylase